MCRGKMKPILLAYGPPHNTVSAIMTLYKNTKAIVCSLDSDTVKVSVTEVFQGHTLAPYRFSIFLAYVLRTSIDLVKEYVDNISFRTFLAC